MAKIVEVTNPVTGQPAQVDQLEHTAQQIDDATAMALRLSNPNLLENWYFVNPVNQRGQVKYTDSWAYSIDRWLCGGDGKVTIADGHCVFYGAVDQGLSVEMSDILGCTMTASLLLTDGTLITGTAVNTDNSIDIPFVSNVGGVFIGLNATDLSKHRRLRIYMGPERAVIAAKLELGSQQTLAHQENGNWVLNEIPDYGEQLARCHGYLLDSRESGSENSYSGIATETWLLVTNVVFPEVMRETPGVKLYNHSAVDHVRRIADNADLALPSSMVVSRTKNGVTFIYNPNYADTFIKGASYDFNVVANAEL